MEVNLPRNGDDGDEERPRGSRGIEDRLLRARVVPLFEAIQPRSSRRVVSSLLVLEAEDAEKPVTVLINSPGGSVADAFAMYDVMRFLRCPVRVLVLGLCASAGNIVLLGAPRGSRLALPNARFMLHQPSMGVHGQASDVEISAREILKLRERLHDLLAAETGQTAERIAEDTNRDFWLTSADAVEYGLVDRVVTKRGELD